MNPWDRQEGEPIRWFQRFEFYRNLGHKRSLEATWRAELERETGEKVAPRSRGRGHRLAPNSWHLEAARWKWKERVAAWDNEQIRLARQEEEAELRKRRKAHIQQALKMQGLGDQGLDHLQPHTFSVQEVLRLIEAGVRQELLARGAPESITEERKRDLPAESLDDGLLERIASGALEEAQEAQEAHEDAPHLSPEPEPDPGNDDHPPESSPGPSP